MAHDVFVSYSQVDKTTADAVVAGLEADSIRCWIAPRDITPGASWGDAIVEAITSSSAMVLVLSSNSNESRQVVREVERAVANGVMIIPFRIQEIEPTGAMAYFLGTEHWLDAMTPPLRKHLDRLGSTLAAVLRGESVVEVPPPPPAPPARFAVPRWAWAAAVGAIALVVGLVGILGTGDAPPADGDTATTVPPSVTVAATAPVTDEASPPEVAEEANPVLLTQVAEYRTSRALNGFDIDGVFAALANGDGGLVYMSVSDPDTPRPMFEYSVDGAVDVTLSGHTAFVIGGEQHARHLVAVDLDGGGGFGLPKEPDQAHTASLYNILAAGDHVYLAGHDFVGVVDVLDPTAPRLVATWAPDGMSGNPCDVFVDGDIGYFSAGWDGLYVMDLGDPAAPVEIGRLDTPDWIIDVRVVDEIAYLTLGDSGLSTVDISDPTRPLLMGRVDLPAFASPLAVAEGLAFAGMFDDDGPDTAVAIIDVSDPTTPVLLSTHGRYGLVTDLEVSNGHLFVADESMGMYIYSIDG